MSVVYQNASTAQELPCCYRTQPAKCLEYRRSWREQTDDLEKFNQRVRDNGGQVMMEKMPVPKMGYLSVCMDPEGNAFGSWLDDPNAA